MITFMPGDIAIINLPEERRGKPNGIHKKVATVVNSHYTVEKFHRLITVKVKIGEHEQNVHVKREYLAPTTPESHPELYI